MTNFRRWAIGASSGEIWGAAELGWRRAPAPLTAGPWHRSATAGWTALLTSRPARERMRLRFAKGRPIGLVRGALRARALELLPAEGGQTLALIRDSAAAPRSPPLGARAGAELAGIDPRRLVSRAGGTGAMG